MEDLILPTILRISFTLILPNVDSKAVIIADLAVSADFTAAPPATVKITTNKILAVVTNFFSSILPSLSFQVA